MDEQNGKAQVPQSDTLAWNYYQQGMKVLARIIARSLIRQQSQSKQTAIQKQTDIHPESLP